MLHRYLFRQITTATILAVLFFVFVLVAGNALRELFGLLAEGKIDWLTFGYLVAVLVPAVAPLALPLGLLTGILLVLGRLSAQNEITAMRASGIPLFRLTAAIYALALIGTLFSMVMQFYYEPMAKTELRKTLATGIREDPLRFLKARTFITEFPGYVIYFESRQGDALQGFHGWELDSENRTVRSIVAEQGTITYLEDEAALLLTVVNAQNEFHDPDAPESPQQVSLPVHYRETRLKLPLHAIVDEPQRRLDYLALHELLERRTAIINDPGLNETERLEQRIGIQTYIQKRFAFSFAVLALGALAIPLGISVGRVETQANLALALVLAMGYFLLTIAISWLESHPRWRPDLLIWLPNLAYQTAGLWLTARMAAR